MPSASKNHELTALHRLLEGHEEKSRLGTIFPLSLLYPPSAFLGSNEYTSAKNFTKALATKREDYTVSRQYAQHSLEQLSEKLDLVESRAGISVGSSGALFGLATVVATFAKYLSPELLNAALWFSAVVAVFATLTMVLAARASLVPPPPLPPMPAEDYINHEVFEKSVADAFLVLRYNEVYVATALVLQEKRAILRRAIRCLVCTVFLTALFPFVLLITLNLTSSGAEHGSSQESGQDAPVIARPSQ